jgi:hypothetical protein
MSFPETFWEEFDRRLDARLDAKLDEKLDARFKEFEKSLDVKLKQRFKNIDNWIARQDRNIEDEMTQSIKNHLSTYYNGYITIKPTIFPKVIKYQNGTELTEFDGVLLLTNSKTYATFVSNSTKQSPEEIININKDDIIYMVIVEAKQLLTHNKVVHKIEQKEKIENMLTKMKSGELPIPPNMVRYRFDMFQPIVGLFLGGTEVEPAAINKIKTYATTHEMCGWLDVNGTRFNVNDKTNDFGEAQYGGKRRKAIPK